MEVNRIDTSLVSLKSLPDNKNIATQTAKSNAVYEDSSSYTLTIKDYNKKRDELSASLQAYNVGMGKSTVAQKGLEEQQKTLKNIQDKLEALTLDKSKDNNKIKNNLNKELLQFREIAYQTTYNKERLISVDDYDSNPLIEISTNEAYYSINKPNTPKLASSISQNISKNDLNSQDGISNSISTVNSGFENLQNIAEQFEELRANLLDSARESINEQRNLSNQNKRHNQTNFIQESENFSKNSVTNNSGYLVSSQANIVQDQSVRLLN